MRDEKRGIKKGRGEGWIFPIGCQKSGEGWEEGNNVVFKVRRNTRQAKMLAKKEKRAKRRLELVMSLTHLHFVTASMT